MLVYIFLCLCCIPGHQYMRAGETMPAGSRLGLLVITEAGSKRKPGDWVPAECDFNVGSCMREMQPFHPTLFFPCRWQCISLFLSLLHPSHLSLNITLSVPHSCISFHPFSVPPPSLFPPSSLSGRFKHSRSFQCHPVIPTSVDVWHLWLRHYVCEWRVQGREGGVPLCPGPSMRLYAKRSHIFYLSSAAHVSSAKVSFHSDQGQNWTVEHTLTTY